MSLLCPHCHEQHEFRFVREFEDEHGRRWEVYECNGCGYQKEYAVA